MLTLAEWILRLTKGYTRFTGKKPDGLAKLKIKLEAAQRVKDQGKVVKGNFNPNEKWWEAGSPKVTAEKATPIKKNLSDETATFQIQKLQTEIPHMKRTEVLQLMDDITAKKAYGAFDDVQRKELLDAISKVYTRKPDFASGGIAGQLHLNRPGYAEGEEIEKRYPYNPHRRVWPPSLRTPELREDVRKKREEAAFEAMWRGAPPSMKEREKMYRKERTATKMEEERIEAFAKKINERKKRYPYADMTEKEFAKLHPKVYDMMKKDPGWNWKTFQKVSFVNPGETFQATGARDIDLPLGKTDLETLDLFMTPFGEDTYEMSSEGPFNKTKIMSDYDKAAVALHELRHKNIVTDDELVAAQPPLAEKDILWRKQGPLRYPIPTIDDTPAQEPKGPPVYQHLNPPGSKEKYSSPLPMHEVFTRFIDRQYGSTKTPSGPYFDKIWRDQWKPYFEKYEKILKERKDPERGVEVLAAKGGLAHVLGV